MQASVIIFLIGVSVLMSAIALQVTPPSWVLVRLSLFFPYFTFTITLALCLQRARALQRGIAYRAVDQPNTRRNRDWGNYLPQGLRNVFGRARQIFA